MISNVPVTVPEEIAQLVKEEVLPYETYTTIHFLSEAFAYDSQRVTISDLEVTKVKETFFTCFA